MASLRSEPRSFNRIAQRAIATEVFSLLTLGKLIRVNRLTQDVEPWLAETWAASPDQRTYTLTLRDGVAWSDGTPFTSADVAFSFAAAYAPATRSPLAASLSVDGTPLRVDTPDARTVVITYPSVFGPGIRLLDNLPIMPRHKLAPALEAGRFADAWAASTAPTDLVAIGPFMLAEYRPAERQVFVRNPRYWRKDDRGVQLPYLDRLTLDIVPDLDAEVVRLQSGQSDFMNDSLRASDLETMRPLELQGKMQVEELGVTPDADAFVFNLRETFWKKDPRRAWIARREFRQALSHAVDREAFADTVFLGAAVPIHGPVTPGNREWFWPSIPRYEFSRAKAAALLKGIGLENRDADEWLEDAQGDDVRFATLVFRGNPVLERSAAVLRDDFRHIGVQLDVVGLETGAVQARVGSGDFESAFIQFNATDTDPAMSKDFWLSSGDAHFWNPAQKSPSTEWEQQIDQLIVRQSAVMDPNERKRLFNDVQRIFSEHLPALYFAAPRVYVATSARMVNVQAAAKRPQVTWSADTLAVRDTGAQR